MIKLTSLNPKWVGYGGERVTNADGSAIPERHGVGLSFLCPCLGKCGQRVYLSFENPLDDKGPIANDGRDIWIRTGDTFENLTLTPSIQRRASCSWHGYLTRGYLKECGE